MHARMHTYTHTHTHTHTHTNTHTQTHTHTHAHTLAYTLTHVHVHTRACVHTDLKAANALVSVFLSRDKLSSNTLQKERYDKNEHTHHTHT